MSPVESRLDRVMRRFKGWSARLTLILMIAAIVSGFSTYAALTETPPFGDDPNTVIWLLNLDLIILTLLVTVIARRIVKVWSGRRQGVAAARLHVRLVFIFSLLAAAPAIIMTVFTAFFLHYGVQGWFSERVSTAVRESQAVAEAYLEEHRQVIRADILAMANDLDRQASLLLSNGKAFEEVMDTQTMMRNFSEAAVFNRSGRLMATSGLTFSLTFETIPASAMAEANGGDVVVMADDHDDRVRALVKLNNFVDGYLFVGRMVDPVVLSHVADTRRVVQEYKMLEGQRSDLQVTMTMIFVVVALLLMLAAIGFGLMFARQLVAPIGTLITAADRVRAGDLTARVPEHDRGDEFDVMARAFNRMTSQIQEQRDELIAANRQLDHRRQFTETVLAGVSSGIVGVDGNGVITLVNDSAAELFQAESRGLIGQSITVILPETKTLLDQAHQKPDKITQGEIPFVIKNKDEMRRTFLVRIAIEMIGEEDAGAVLTFDDITELQSAQRKAAWADVARRIAHEIKNPLTPIQLSAERLRRKYLKQITDDPETFSKCTDTIIHHVGDIGRMVNEFSAFARMPEPVMRRENLTAQIRDLLVLQQQAHPKIKFELASPKDSGAPLFASFDTQQIRQAFTNIIQNAIDSVGTKMERERREGGSSGASGKIKILLTTMPDQGNILISVMDSGIGFPKNEDPTRLTEPYVTHREKGTGLGLAIVKKIMEDHNGRIVMGTPEWLRHVPGWEDLGGATVTLVLPLESVNQTEAAA